MDVVCTAARPQRSKVENCVIYNSTVVNIASSLINTQVDTQSLSVAGVLTSMVTVRSSSIARCTGYKNKLSPDYQTK